jgi:hypothetical protein
MEQTKDILWDLHDEKTNIVPLEFTNDLQPELFGLQVNEAQQLVSGIDIVKHELDVLKNAYIDVIELEITTENLPIFKDLRKNFTKNRTSAEKLRKAKKAYFLNGGRFVDAIFKNIDAEREMMESKLLEAEKFFENQEKARIKALNDARIERLRPYLENVDGQDFSMMDNYDFDDFVEVKKLQFERKQEAERIERERIEAERLAEIERQKAIEAENAKLKAEAEAQRLEAQRLAKIEAEKQAKIQAQLEKERAEAKAKQDAIQAEADRKAREEKAKQDAILAQERAEKQKLIDAENARLAEIEKQRIEAEKLAKAPIQKQLTAWVDGFEIANAPIDNEVSKDIQAKFNAFKAWAKTQIQK